MAHLIIQNGESAPHEISLVGENITIGRVEDNTIILDDASVSSHHAEVVFESGNFILRDLQSANGTTVNGQRMTEAILNDGDRIAFANIECTFQESLRPAQDGSQDRVGEMPDLLDTELADSFGMENGNALGISTTLGLFKSLDYAALFPLKKIFDQELLKKKAVRWVLLFGLFPIAIYLAALNLDLTFNQTVWLLEGYFCLFCALYFYTLIQPGTAIWKRAIGYALFTAFIGIPLDYAAQHLPVIRNLYATAFGDSSFIGKFFGLVLGVGILEETCKALPLLLFGLRKNNIGGVREGLFLGFMSGLGFAAAEGVAYSLNAATTAAQAAPDIADAAFTSQVLQTIFRMMTGPLLHGAWAGVVGWFIGFAVIRPKPRWPIIVVGICCMALLHGINNVASGTIMHLATAGLSIVLLMVYIKHEPAIADTEQVQPVLQSADLPSPIQSLSRSFAADTDSQTHSFQNRARSFFHEHSKTILYFCLIVTTIGVLLKNYQRNKPTTQSSVSISVTDGQAANTSSRQQRKLSANKITLNELKVVSQQLPGKTLKWARDNIGKETLMSHSNGAVYLVAYLGYPVEPSHEVFSLFFYVDTSFGRNTISHGFIAEGNVPGGKVVYNFSEESLPP